jgi:hypothetical protein
VKDVLGGAGIVNPYSGSGGIIKMLQIRHFLTTVFLGFFGIDYIVTRSAGRVRRHQGCSRGLPNRKAYIISEFLCGLKRAAGRP